MRNPTLLSPVKITFTIMNQIKVAAACWVGSGVVLGPTMGMLAASFLPQLNVAVGHSIVQLSAIPVLEEEDQTAIESIMPVELYVEKPKMKIIPPWVEGAPCGRQMPDFTPARLRLQLPQTVGPRLGVPRPMYVLPLRALLWRCWGWGDGSSAGTWVG